MNAVQTRYYTYPFNAILVIVLAIIALQMSYTYALPVLSTIIIEESILALIYVLAGRKVSLRPKDAKEYKERWDILENKLSLI